MFSIFFMSSENFRLEYTLWTVTQNEYGSNYGSQTIQNTQSRNLSSVQEKEQTLETDSRYVCMRGRKLIIQSLLFLTVAWGQEDRWQNGLRHLPRAYYYYQLGRWGQNAVVSLAALNHCTSVREERKGFKAFFLLKSLKMKRFQWKWMMQG